MNANFPIQEVGGVHEMTQNRDGYVKFRQFFSGNWTEPRILHRAAIWHKKIDFIFKNSSFLIVIAGEKEVRLFQYNISL